MKYPEYGSKQNVTILLLHGGGLSWLKAGAEYEENLTLSADTIAELETPMISAEEYIRNVNGI